LHITVPLVFAKSTEKYFHIRLDYQSCLHCSFDLLFTILSIWSLQLSVLHKISGINIWLVMAFCQIWSRMMKVARYLANWNWISGTSLQPC